MSRPADPAAKRAKAKIDLGTAGGITLALGGILAGLWLDGGSLAQVLQPTAALIVLGGTCGAVLVQFSAATVRQALVRLREALFSPRSGSEGLVENLVGYAMKARRKGMLALDADLESIADPFLKKSLMLAIDGVGLRELRTIMEVDLDSRDETEEQPALVFEAAGGFAPTIGILGAVLGLIQVMQRLDNINAVGRGIAVAFVATLYGVGSANLLFLPLAGRLRAYAREKQREREMILEAVIAILEGDRPAHAPGEAGRLLVCHAGAVAAPASTGSSPGEAPRAIAPGASCRARALAGLLCRFHDAAVRFFCRALRLVSP